MATKKRGAEAISIGIDAQIHYEMTSLASRKNLTMRYLLDLCARIAHQSLGDVARDRRVKQTRVQDYGANVPARMSAHEYDLLQPPCKHMNLKPSTAIQDAWAAHRRWFESHPTLNISALPLCAQAYAATLRAFEERKRLEAEAKDAARREAELDAEPEAEVTANG